MTGKYSCDGIGRGEASFMEMRVEHGRLVAMVRESQARRLGERPASKAAWRLVIGTSPGDEPDREAERPGEIWRRGEGSEEEFGD